MGILNPAYTQYLPAVNQASQTYGVPVNILLSIGQQETSWGTNPNTNVSGPAGELGIMQLTPNIVQTYGVSNPLDPTQNIDGAAAYLATLYQKTGNWSSAVAAYNGSGSAAQAYSNQVMARANQLGGVSGAPSSGVPASGAIANSTQDPNSPNANWLDPMTWYHALTDSTFLGDNTPAAVGEAIAGGNNNPVTGQPFAPGSAGAQAAQAAQALNPMTWLSQNWPMVAAIAGAGIVGLLALGMIFKSSSGSKTTIVPLPA